MENFVLIGAQQDTLFFLHIKPENYDFYPSYHLFYALEHMDLIKSKNVIVNIFELGISNEIEMISLQHVERNAVSDFDVENLDELFKSLCEGAKNLNCIILEFIKDSNIYNHRLGSINLSHFQNKKVSTVEYIQIKNMVSVPQEPVEEVVEEGVQETQAVEPVAEEVAQE